MKRAVLYARVSSNDQTNDGRNLAGQLDMCREYAQQNGWQVVAELPEDDRGVSGHEINLPQLNRVRDMAAAGEFDVLIVRELDRLSRNLAKQLIIEEELRAAGVEIRFVNEQYDDTPEGSLQKLVKGAVAEYERLKIAERTKRGRRRKVQDGHVIIHGNPPYGYRKGEKDGKATLVIHEEEARVVQLMFEWYVNGDEEVGPTSLYGVTKRLSGMQIPTWADKRPGTKKENPRGRWNLNSVRKILHRETYAGTWHYGKVRNSGSKQGDNPRDTWVSVQVPAIIARELWEAAQERMKHNTKFSGRNCKHNYLLRRRAICGDCGAKMCVHGMKKTSAGYHYRYYSCQVPTMRHNYARQCKQKAHIRADHVDAAVWGWVRQLLLHPKATIEGMQRKQAEREDACKPMRRSLAAAERKIAETQAKLDRALEAYLEDAMLREMLAEKASAFKQTIAELERQEGELEEQIAARIISDEQIQTIADFVGQMGEGIMEADKSFKKRRRLIDQLNLTARLAIEDGERVAYVSCLAGDGRAPIAATI